MDSQLFATVIQRSGEVRTSVEVDEMTTVGIIITEPLDPQKNQGSIEVLIPWHRVHEVYADVNGTLRDHFIGVENVNGPNIMDAFEK